MRKTTVWALCIAGLTPLATIANSQNTTHDLLYFFHHQIGDAFKSFDGKKHGNIKPSHTEKGYNVKIYHGK